MEKAHAVERSLALLGHCSAPLYSAQFPFSVVLISTLEAGTHFVISTLKFLFDFPSLGCKKETCVSVNCVLAGWVCIAALYVPDKVFIKW